jgi:transposase
LELGADWKRFERATSLSAWLALTPSLTQSGESARQGSITKTGSMLARRLLVESAWHYGKQPRLGATLANRQPVSPSTSFRSPTVLSNGFSRSTERLKARGKRHNIVVVACARQLAGFLGAAATAD